VNGGDVSPNQFRFGPDGSVYYLADQDQDEAVELFVARTLHLLDAGTPR